MYNIYYVDFYVGFETGVIYLLKKFKIYVIGLLSMIMLVLTSCGNTEPMYKQQGLTQLVEYNFGEGVCIKDGRETNVLTLYYKPGSYITDLVGVQNYEFSRASDGETNYEFDGWYFDENFQQKVDFDTYTLPTNSNTKITLYAKWSAIIESFFDIYYMPEGSDKYELITSLKWETNKPFTFSSRDIQYPDTKNDYTFIEAYTDDDMTKLVDSSYVLTKEVNHLPVYTKWVKGKYIIANDAADYRNYFVRYSNEYNLYINADIDLTGVSIPNTNLLSGKTILGNNHTISNLSYSTITSEGKNTGTVTVGGLAVSMENCVIKDLHFVNATYEMNVLMCSYLTFGALAGTISDSSIENVTIEGNVVYDAKTLERFDAEKSRLMAIRVSKDLAYSMTNTNVESCNVQLTGIKEELE